MLRLRPTIAFSPLHSGVLGALCPNSCALWGGPSSARQPTVASRRQFSRAVLAATPLKLAPMSMGMTPLSTVVKRCSSTTGVPNIRNIAIIAHVDHGKTTLVDCLLKQSSVGSLAHERAMDFNPLERERGITILSKCTSVSWTDNRAKEGEIKDFQVNIVDTPGHADFGGEVERIMSMVDGVALVVDATDGPMTQTKFVLGKALQKGLKPIVVINKVDRPTSRPAEVENAIFDLMCTLGATDAQLDFPIMYASAKEGWAVRNLNDERKDMRPLFETIISYIPLPQARPSDPFSLLVTQIERNKFFGKLLLGKITSGSIKLGDPIIALDEKGKVVDTGKVIKLLAKRGFEQVPLESGHAGDIMSVAGLEKASVNSTLAAPSVKEPLPVVPIDPPTISMTMAVNTSPLAGSEGVAVTSSQLRDRLLAEAETNVSIAVYPSAVMKDAYEVHGRGELQLGVLIETMRREKMEMSIYSPQVVLRKDDKKNVTEPMEEVIIDCQNDAATRLIELLTLRKGNLLDFVQGADGRSRLVFHVPTRGLIGFQSEFRNETRGEGVLNHSFHSWVPYKGLIERNEKGALICTDQGTTTTYGLIGLEQRGTLFVGDGVKVYPGMIIGEVSREGDLEVNPAKAKATSNMRTTEKSDRLVLQPPRTMTLEEAISYIRDDEMIEVTPTCVRMRKIELDPQRRSQLRKTRKLQREKERDLEKMSNRS